jgi:hypothetical protein
MTIYRLVTAHFTDKNAIFLGYIGYYSTILSIKKSPFITER